MVFSAPIQGVKLQGRRSPNAQTRRPVGKPSGNGIQPGLGPGPLVLPCIRCPMGRID